jgi:hypothetical protein
MAVPGLLGDIPGTEQGGQGPLVPDATMADIIRRLYIAATGGYHDGPLFPEESPYPPLAPYDRGRPPIANERPGPIPNMTVDDFRRGFDATPRDDVDWWLRSKLEPREADI